VTRALISALLFVLAGGAFAQAYPTKPVKIYVPAQPGGGLDLVGRMVGDLLSKSLGQTFVIENNSGAGGALASQATARAAPDGYTIMVAYVGTHGTNPAVRKLPYDAINDFTPIAMVGGTRNILVVQPSLPVKDMKELVAYLKANSGKITYATGGIGLLNHLAVEQFRGAVGFDAQAAHYRGIGPAIVDFLGGQTLLMMPGLAAALPHMRAGKMKAIAITGRQRHPLAPDVPTFEELGYKDFDGVQWYGIAGPAKLPPEITQKLNAEINKAIVSPAVREKLAADAIDPMPMTPEEFGRFIQADIRRWSALAKERNISLD